MSSLPVKKLYFAAGNYFGPVSGLGALSYGPLGESRSLLGQRLRLPLSLPAPFLWEVHLTSTTQAAVLRLGLAGDREPAGEVRLTPGRRAEVVGVAAARGADPVRALDFLVYDPILPGQVVFLGLSVLPLVDHIASAAHSS